MAETSVSPDLAKTQPLDPALRVKLSAMMFLQYAIWGIWAPILGLHLGSLAAFQTASGDPDFGKIGLIYMTMPIASIIGPFIGGQIADRYFAAQRFVGVSQFLGGLVLLAVTQLNTFVGVFAGMLVYNLLYAPTIALTNSITFQHWPNDRFSKIRAWGSIGWIVIGWVFGVAWMKYLGKQVHTPAMVDCLYMAAALSFIYAVFCLVLPNTPPAKQGGNPLAFLDAIAMMKKPAFAVMAIISFFVAIELQLYFVFGQSYLNQSGGPFKPAAVAQYYEQEHPGDATAAETASKELLKKADTDADKRLSRKELSVASQTEPLAKAFLEAQDKVKAQKGGIGLDESDVSPIMTFGQICEMVMMLLLSAVMVRFGFKITMVLGIAAWALRDLVFAIGQPVPLVIGAVALHGIGFAFFFTVIFIFTDKVAPPGIKSSAQSFLASVTIGCGMLVGSLLAGPISTACGGNWHQMFLVPAAICGVCCLLFLAGFKDSTRQQG